jgi:hypothetical protein
MKVYGFDGRGDVFIERVTTKPTWSSDEEGRLIYTEDNDRIYIGTSSMFKSLIDIPYGTIVLFEANTAVSGYDLLTNVDDKLVYITKGSAAGGYTAGDEKGSWTDGLSHTHTTSPHTLTKAEIPPHEHVVTDGYAGQYQYWGGTSYSGSSSAIPYYWYLLSTYLDDGSGDGLLGQSHSHGDTSDAVYTNSNWRPKGINMTRQQRNE